MTPSVSLHQRSRLLDRLFIVSDILALLLAYRTAHFLRFSETVGPVFFGFLNGLFGWGSTADLSGSVHEVEYLRGALWYLVPIAVILHGLYAMRGLYEGHRFLKRQPVFWRMLTSNALMLGGIVVILYFRRNVWHPRSFFLTVFALNVVFMLILRSLARHILMWTRRRKGVGGIPVVLVGETPEARVVDEIVEGRHPHGFFIAARLPSPRDGDLKELARCVKQTGAGLVILADDAMSVSATMHLLDLTARMDVAAKVLTHQLSVLQLRAGELFDTIRGVPLVHFEEPSTSDKDGLWRRTLSRALAAVALVVLSPVFLVTALLIKLTDRGPVFFVQERFGVDRRPFRMYKFRTMRVNAEAMLPHLEVRNEAGGGLFKLRDDPRITPVGRLLRRFSIDELPQIFNVLKGDMRIVGPRPLPRRDLSNYYEDWHYHRHNGRPGLTCLWQVSGRSEIDFDNMCILDVYYLRNHTWRMDLRIVLRTVGVVLFGKGAY